MSSSQGREVDHPERGAPLGQIASGAKKSRSLTASRLLGTVGGEAQFAARRWLPDFHLAIRDILAICAVRAHGKPRRREARRPVKPPRPGPGGQKGRRTQGAPDGPSLLHMWWVAGLGAAFPPTPATPVHARPAADAPSFRLAPLFRWRRPPHPGVPVAPCRFLGSARWRTVPLQPPPPLFEEGAAPPASGCPRRGHRGSPPGTGDAPPGPAPPPAPPPPRG